MFSSRTVLFFKGCWKSATMSIVIDPPLNGKSNIFLYRDDQNWFRSQNFYKNVYSTKLILERRKTAGIC